MCVCVVCVLYVCIWSFCWFVVVVVGFFCWFFVFVCVIEHLSVMWGCFSTILNLKE